MIAGMSGGISGTSECVAMADPERILPACVRERETRTRVAHPDDTGAPREALAPPRPVHRDARNAGINGAVAPRSSTDRAARLGVKADRPSQYVRERQAVLRFVREDDGQAGASVRHGARASGSWWSALAIGAVLHALGSGSTRVLPYLRPSCSAQERRKSSTTATCNIRGKPRRARSRCAVQLRDGRLD